MLKVVIIEDEKYTAKDLAETLKKIDNDIDIVSILSSVEEALVFFRVKNVFDLIFSDIPSRITPRRRMSIFHGRPPQPK